MAYGRILGVGGTFLADTNVFLCCQTLLKQVKTPKKIAAGQSNIMSVTRSTIPAYGV